MHISLISFLLFSLLIIIITFTQLNYSNQSAYAHNLSSNENASLLELFYQIQTQTELVQSNFPFNNILAHEHSKDAISELFSKNWTKVVADRIIVVNILLPSLNALNQLTESRNSSYSEVKGEVSVLNSILYRFISLYYGGNNVFYNSTIQALILAEITNDISDNYGRALGITIKSSTMTMSPMVMDDKEPSVVNDTMNNMMMKTMTFGKKSNHPMSSHTIVNAADYQSAQVLAIKAKQIFNKNLKPIAPRNATNANLELGKDFDQLKSAIDNKAPIMDIMKIVHVQIHPLLITTYNLQLKH
jgi:hypothetical protein